MGGASHGAMGAHVLHATEVCTSKFAGIKIASVIAEHYTFQCSVHLSASKHVCGKVSATGQTSIEVAPTWSQPLESSNTHSISTAQALKSSTIKADQTVKGSTGYIIGCGNEDPRC